MALIKFWDICFKSDGDYKSYDEMVQGALDDDCYQKMYPVIASEVLLKSLIHFVQDINNRPTEDGVDHATLYRKTNGRQIDSSRRYYLVKEPNLVEFNLYAKITKGTNLGFYRIYTNQDEVKILMKYYLNYLKREGRLPTVADCLQYVQDSKYLIARERCEFISRLLNNNVSTARDNSTVDYDVTKLGTRQQQTQKCSKETPIAMTVFSSTPIRQPSVQKQVLSPPATNNNTSHSPSLVAKHAQSPPLKKQKNDNSKLNKKKQPQLSSKSTTEPPASASSLRSTPILNRLRIRPDDHTTAAASSSSYNSTSEPVIAKIKSKTKQTARTKKREHPSKN